MGDRFTVEKRLAALIVLFAFCAAGLMAQAASSPETAEDGTNNRPQWMRDLRRWEIVALGSFPFTMFFSTIGMDMYRWHRETGMDWGRREYAPWPITSAGGVSMTDAEQRRTIFIAIGLSAGVAVADHLIQRGRRERERRRAEAIPAGTIIITRTPLHEDEPDEPDDPAPYDDEISDGDGVPQDAEDAEAAPQSPP